MPLPKIGLALNPPGVPFRCGACEYFDTGTCTNPEPELKGRKVKPVMCCDLYKHAKMKVILP